MDISIWMTSIYKAIIVSLYGFASNPRANWDTFIVFDSIGVQGLKMDSSITRLLYVWASFLGKLAASKDSNPRLLPFFHLFYSNFLVGLLMTFFKLFSRPTLLRANEVLGLLQLWSWLIIRVAHSLYYALTKL